MLDRQTMQVAVQDIQSADPAVSVAAIISHDGLVMVSTHPDRDENELLAAMVSEVLSKGKQSVREMDLGSFFGEVLFGTTGGLMMRKINDEMVLVARFAPEVNVGRLFGRLSQAVNRIGEP